MKNSAKALQTDSRKSQIKKENLAAYLDSLLPTTHPKWILHAVKNQVQESREDKSVITEHDDLFKASTLREFDVGVLLNAGFPDYLKTFSIDLSIKLQEEYGCKKPSEKATAHLAAHSYCRILNLQRRIKDYLDIDRITQIGNKYLDFLSRDLDRAERHYLNAIQTLRMMKQPPIHLTVKTNQANFAQNMIARQEII